MEGFTKAFRKLINERIEAIESRILGSSIDSMEEYRALCGELKGLKDSLIFMSDAVKQYIDEEVIK